VEQVIKPKELMYFLLLSSKTAFWKLEDLLPECFLYREKYERIEPLICLREDHSCHVGQNCMETVAKRLHALFEQVLPRYVDLVLLYFRKRNLPGMGAGVFWKDFRTPRVINMNLGGWNRVKLRGEVLRFTPGESFFLSGRAPEPTQEPAQSKLILP